MMHSGRRWQRRSSTQKRRAHLAATSTSDVSAHVNVASTAHVQQLVDEYSRQRAILDRMRDHHQRGTVQYEEQKKLLLDLWTRIQASDEDPQVTEPISAATATTPVAPATDSTHPIVVAPMSIDFGEQEDGYAWAVRLVQQVNQGMSSYMQNLINGLPR